MLSPSNRPRKINRQRIAAFSGGTREFCVVDPIRRTVEVSLRGKPSIMYARHEDIPVQILPECQFPPVRSLGIVSEEFANGFLHRAAEPSPDCLVLTHGAGSNCQAPLLVAMADALSATAWNVYRFDLSFRRKRPHGSPFPAGAKEDREGIREAVHSIREAFAGAIVLGGHSYGGRQCSIAASEDAQLSDGLLLLSYPLHPPKKPADLRTAHFPELRTKTLFVHGSRDPFGSIEELRAAIADIPAVTTVQVIERAGHELGRPPVNAAQVIATAVQGFFGRAG